MQGKQNTLSEIPDIIFMIYLYSLRNYRIGQIHSLCYPYLFLKLLYKNTCIHLTMNVFCIFTKKYGGQRCFVIAYTQQTDTLFSEFCFDNLLLLCSLKFCHTDVL